MRSPMLSIIYDAGGRRTGYEIGATLIDGHRCYYSDMEIGLEAGK